MVPRRTRIGRLWYPDRLCLRGLHDSGPFFGWVVLRYLGPETIMVARAALGGIGLAWVVWGNSVVLAGAAVVMWGLGAALGFPIALSAPGDSGPNAADRVKLVAVCGYIALLVGPPVLGFAGRSIRATRRSNDCAWFGTCRDRFSLFTDAQSHRADFRAE